MSSWVDGEKKGLIPLDQKGLADQVATYQLLTSDLIAIPPITPFVIQQKPVLAQLTTSADLEETENIDPKTIVKTQPVRLVRSELPMNFDVVSLSRDVAVEETTLAQLESGRSAPEAYAEDEDNDGGEDEE